MTESECVEALAEKEGTSAHQAVSREVIEAFHMMWDNFPHTALLLKKSREIVAANKSATSKGALPGKKCYELQGDCAIHAGCKGNLALEQDTAQHTVTYNKSTNTLMDAYWMPVSKKDGLFLHTAWFMNLSKAEQSG